MEKDVVLIAQEREDLPKKVEAEENSSLDLEVSNQGADDNRNSTHSLINVE